MDSKLTSTKPVLPVGRVNTIMKSSSDVEIVSKESSVIMSKAAELFIRSLTQEGYSETNQGRKLDYKHLSNVVHSDEKYNFLRDILPKKITVLEFKKIMAKKEAAERGSDGEDSSSEEESSSEESNSSKSSDDSQKH
ncbi:nuclear transcription factor Y subunit C-6 [Sitophilus oryzae]|uniref:Nuclear transcription factor Y subunit C-6 n=1 Tax=Sitophilus oryzae TaxID=7048 RepID=A0A6J2YJU6_SITOR|nr:nuclear transcription factor Y subunit C-6 [Sitophilus oryzae]